MFLIVLGLLEVLLQYYYGLFEKSDFFCSQVDNIKYARIQLYTICFVWVSFLLLVSLSCWRKWSIDKQGFRRLGESWKPWVSKVFRLRNPYQKLLKIIIIKFATVFVKYLCKKSIYSSCLKKNIWLHLPLKIFASVLYCSSVFFLHKYHTLPCSINILYNEWPGRSKCKFFICSAKISCWTPDGHLTDQSTNQLIADISQGPSCQTQSFTYTLNFILRLYYYYFVTVDEGATKVLFAFFTLTNTEKLVKYAYIF